MSGSGSSGWRVRRLAPLVLLSGLLGACDQGGARAGSEREVAARAPIEVFSWGGLQADLVREHERRHPLDQIIHANPQLSYAARKLLSQRLLEGDPPDAFQSNGGSDLMRWVVFNEVDARESRVTPLDDLPDMAELSGTWPKMLRDALTYDGRLYAVPANVHRLNVIFYNPAVLKLVQARPPETVADLFALGKALRRRGIPLFAVGSKDPWTLSLLIIESLLVAQHGPDFYEDYFAGRLNATDPRIAHTLETGLRLLEYANPERYDLHWEQAAQLVFDGRAAMTVMGDWAKTLFDASGADVSSRYREMSFPGTESVFVFACNAFAVPLGAKNADGARRLLMTLLSREGQEAIGRSKTSIPTRLDVDVAAPDAAQREKQHLWRSGRLLLAQSAAVSPRVADDLKQALEDADRERRISPVLHTLRARYMLLGR